VESGGGCVGNVGREAYLGLVWEHEGGEELAFFRFARCQ
jgi:hypothetical protein